jgi:hypothetical protein
MDFKLAIDCGSGAHASSARSEGVNAARPEPAVTVAVCKKCLLESMKPPIDGKAIIGGL